MSALGPEGLPSPGCLSGMRTPPLKAGLCAEPGARREEPRALKGPPAAHQAAFPLPRIEERGAGAGAGVGGGAVGEGRGGVRVGGFGATNLLALNQRYDSF